MSYKIGLTLIELIVGLDEKILRKIRYDYFLDFHVCHIFGRVPKSQLIPGIQMNTHIKLLDRNNMPLCHI